MEWLPSQVYRRTSEVLFGNDLFHKVFKGRRPAAAGSAGAGPPGTSARGLDRHRRPGADGDRRCVVRTARGAAGRQGDPGAAGRARRRGLRPPLRRWRGLSRPDGGRQWESLDSPDMMRNQRLVLGSASGLPCEPVDCRSTVSTPWVNAAPSVRWALGPYPARFSATADFQQRQELVRLVAARPRRLEHPPQTVSASSRALPLRGRLGPWSPQCAGPTDPDP